MNNLLLLISLLGNLWIWKIISINPPLGVLLIFVSLLTLVYYKQDTKKRRAVYVFLISILVLSYFQIKTTTFENLSHLDNDEQRVQQMRLKEYPPVKLSLFDKTLWFPVAHWLDGRKETTAFYRLEKNFFQAIDLNLYFFSNHPRERVGVSEFEKFLYPLLPFFLIGIYTYFKEKRYVFLGVGFLSLVLVSFIGFLNPLGPFLLFPFTSIAIYLGIESAYVKIEKLSLLKRVSTMILFLMICGLSFIQVLAYATK